MVGGSLAWSRQSNVKLDFYQVDSFLQTALTYLRGSFRYCKFNDREECREWPTENEYRFRPC